MSRYARTAALMIAAAALALGAMACGDDDDDGDDTDATAPAPTQPAPVTQEPEETEETEEPGAATTPPVPAGGAVTVAAADFSFSPTAIVASAGLPVRITLNNTGNAPHTLTVYTDEAYSEPVAGADTGQVSGGSSGDFEVTLEEGEHFFRCELHPDQMQGVITVN